jgi:hypothetical protein
MRDHDYEYDDEEDDEYYDVDEGDCELSDKGLYGELFARGHGNTRDYEREMACDNFPPKISSYVKATTRNQLVIKFNYGRNKAWRQAKREIKHFRDVLGYGGEAELNIFNHLFGNDSTLFRKWKDIMKNKRSSYAEFYKFIATFFFECSFSKSYSWLCSHPNVDASHYLDQKRYSELWRIIDEYNKREDYENCAWEEFESAFNELTKRLLIPKRKEFPVDLVIDDDKHWYNNTQLGRDVPLDENMTLARTIHVRDNAKGLTLNVACFTVTNVPCNLCYKRESESELGSKSRFMMGFKLHSGEDPQQGVDDRNSHSRQLSHQVLPLTQEQGDVSWYLMRRHSATSSAMDKVLRKKASYINADHQVRLEYEIVFEYGGINTPLPGSTNNNYNSFDDDNNNSDDSGSLSDYSLHDESVTDIIDMQDMKDGDDDDQECIVKVVRRYKLPNDVNVESTEDDDLHSDNIESTEDVDLRSDGSLSSNSNPFVKSPTNQSSNSDDSWEPVPESIVNNNINNDNIIDNDGDDDDVNDDYSGPVWGVPPKSLWMPFSTTTIVISLNK